MKRNNDDEDGKSQGDRKKNGCEEKNKKYEKGLFMTVSTFLNPNVSFSTELII